MGEIHIDNAHHIMRWVPKNKLRHDPETLEPVGPHPTAFRLRIELKPPEKYLSVSWVEHFAASPEVQVKTTAKLLATQVHTTPNKGGAFAVGLVGDIKADCLSKSSIVPKIISTPTGKRPAYAQVWGIPHDDLSLQTALAFGSWKHVIRAADVLGGV